MIKARHEKLVDTFAKASVNAYTTSTTNEDTTEYIAAVIVNTCRTRETDDAEEGAKIQLARKLNPHEDVTQVLPRSVSAPGQRDPRIGPKAYTIADTIVGPLHKHYGEATMRRWR